MSVIRYMSVICLVLGGVVRVRLFMRICVITYYANGSVRRGSRAPSTDGPGAWPRHLQGPDPRIRHRIQIDMFRPIRLDHTNCLQVSIKTHSFIHNEL
jgi:hypothetical protein